MKQLVISAIVIFSISAKAQNTINWDGKYQLQFSDFQSPSTKIGETRIYSVYPSAVMDLMFNMTNIEFMATKNFNAKVNCFVNRNAASIVAPDSLIAQDLLNFAQFSFDMTELYARKFRKRLFEEKKASSDVNFTKPIYDQVQNEFNIRFSQVTNETDMGRNKEKLQSLHQELLNEIAELSEFCKTCKPSKKTK